MTGAARTGTSAAISGETRPWSREAMAARVARDLEPGWLVNLGIGIPTMVADHIRVEQDIMLHSENGIVGVGPKPSGEIDPWIINAGKEPVTIVPGAAFVHHADSFAIIRGGHVDLSVMGAFEVSVTGDLANWSTGEGRAPAVGGAMDLAVGARRVWVVMDHCTRDGSPRLVPQCRYPLTASAVVDRIYTDLATLAVEDGVFTVLDMAEGMTPDRLAQLTGAPLRFS